MAKLCTRQSCRCFGVGSASLSTGDFKALEESQSESVVADLARLASNPTAEQLRPV